MSEGSGEKGEIPPEANISDDVSEGGGPSLLHPSGTMGQGACGRGVLAKWLNHVTVGKPTFSQSCYHIEQNRSFGRRQRFLRDTTRRRRLKGRMSHPQNLKPRDLCLAKTKPLERVVEV